MQNKKSRAADTKIGPVLRKHNFYHKTKIRLTKCYVFPVLLCTGVLDAITDAISKKMEAFEMWLYRRILRIPWVDRILRRLNKELEDITTIKMKKPE